MTDCLLESFIQGELAMVVVEFLKGRILREWRMRICSRLDKFGICLFCVRFSVSDCMFPCKWFLILIINIIPPLSRAMLCWARWLMEHLVQHHSFKPGPEQQSPWCDSSIRSRNGQRKQASECLSGNDNTTTPFCSSRSRRAILLPSLFSIFFHSKWFLSAFPSEV